MCNVLELVHIYIYIQWSGMNFLQTLSGARIGLRPPAATNAIQSQTRVHSGGGTSEENKSESKLNSSTPIPETPIPSLERSTSRVTLPMKTQTQAQAIFGGHSPTPVFVNAKQNYANEYEIMQPKLTYRQKLLYDSYIAFIDLLPEPWRQKRNVWRAHDDAEEFVVHSSANNSSLESVQELKDDKAVARAPAKLFSNEIRLNTTDLEKITGHAEVKSILDGMWSDIERCCVVVCNGLTLSWFLNVKNKHTKVHKMFIKLVTARLQLYLFEQQALYARDNGNTEFSQRVWQKYQLQSNQLLLWFKHAPANGACVCG